MRHGTDTNNPHRNRLWNDSPNNLLESSCLSEGDLKFFCFGTGGGDAGGAAPGDDPTGSDYGFGIGPAAPDAPADPTGAEPEGYVSPDPSYGANVTVGLPSTADLVATMSPTMAAQFAQDNPLFAEDNPLMFSQSMVHDIVPFLGEQLPQDLDPQALEAERQAEIEAFRETSPEGALPFGLRNSYLDPSFDIGAWNRGESGFPAAPAASRGPVFSVLNPSQAGETFGIPRVTGGQSGVAFGNPVSAFGADGGMVQGFRGGGRIGREALGSDVLRRPGVRIRRLR